VKKQSSTEAIIQEGLDWLAANESAETETFKEKQKEVEDKIRPVFMKLYQGGADGEATSAPASATAPHVEEVD